MTGVRRERVCVYIYKCGKFELQSETRYREPGSTPETENRYVLYLREQQIPLSEDDFYALKAIMAEVE